MPSVFDAFLHSQGFVLLDGGLATELERAGHDLNDPLWSAKILLEEPAAIEAVHASYLRAGADCVITATYQATFEGLAARGVAHAPAEAVFRGAVDLAVRARDRFRAADHSPHAPALSSRPASVPTAPFSPTAPSTTATTASVRSRSRTSTAPACASSRAPRPTSSPVRRSRRSRRHARWRTSSRTQSTSPRGSHLRAATNTASATGRRSTRWARGRTKPRASRRSA